MYLIHVDEEIITRIAGPLSSPCAGWQWLPVSPSLAPNNACFHLQGGNKDK